jgi:hypothetical protein
MGAETCVVVVQQMRLIDRCMDHFKRTFVIVNILLREEKKYKF